MTTVFTTGYEGRTIEGFITDLRRHHIKVLADVREAPISRKPGFSKNALAEALSHAGIGYLHLRALGCPRPIRDAHKADGDWAKYTRAFMKHLDRQQAPLDDLAATCGQQPTALLCFEADYNRCHRTYVARAVAARAAARVMHITPAGLAEDSG
jgi:uncharacterized protein (DUF488 family)